MIKSQQFRNINVSLFNFQFSCLFQHSRSFTFQNLHALYLICARIVCVLKFISIVAKSKNRRQVSLFNLYSIWKYFQTSNYSFNTEIEFVEPKFKLTPEYNEMDFLRGRLICCFCKLNFFIKANKILSYFVYYLHGKYATFTNNLFSYFYCLENF